MRIVSFYTSLILMTMVFNISLITISAAANEQNDKKQIYKMSKIPIGYNFEEITAGAKYKPGELIIRFAPKEDKTHRSIDEKKNTLNSLGGATIKRTFKKIRGLTLVKLPPSQNVKDALIAFNRNDDILYAEPNYKIVLLSNIPNDPCFSQLWGLRNTGQTGGTEDADIDAPEAWDIATDSDIIVAVLDTGIDYDHSDLSENIWINEEELNGTSGYDDDGNGYIDDIYGWDFADNEK